MRHLRYLVLGLLALVVAACGSDETASPSATGTGSRSATPTATVPPTLTATPEATSLPTEAARLPEALLQTLRDDLAETLDISPKGIEVLGAEKVASPDDCHPDLPPEKGCPPVELTPGYRVTLRRLDFLLQYIYHTDGTERFAGPYGLPTPAPSPVSPDSLPSQLLELLREDLARRLSATPESIELALVEEAFWPDGCLGLPAPEQCLGPGTLGYRVTLLVVGQEQIYHTDREESFVYVGPVDAQ